MYFMEHVHNHVITWRSRRWDVCDVWVMLKSWWIVIDVSHGDQHAGGTGKRPWGTSITGNHYQCIIFSCLPVQQCTGDDLSCGGVDGELRVSTYDPVTKTESRDGRFFLGSILWHLFTVI